MICVFILFALWPFTDNIYQPYDSVSGLAIIYSICVACGNRDIIGKQAFGRLPIIFASLRKRVNYKDDKNT